MKGPRRLAQSQLVVERLSPETVPLGETEARHLKALRARPGDEIYATDGAGCRALLVIERLGPRDGTAAVRDCEREDVPGVRWWLATRAAGARFDWLLEKAVELGCWSVLPLAAASGFASGRRERWRRVADAALRQSGGRWRMGIEEPTNLSGLASVPGGGRWKERYWADPEGRPAAGQSPGGDPGDRLLLVGPPEGFSTAERQVLQDSPEWTAIALGPRRLRAETAALAGLAWALCWGSAEKRRSG